MPEGGFPFRSKANRPKDLDISYLQNCCGQPANRSKTVQATSNYSPNNNFHMEWQPCCAGRSKARIQFSSYLSLDGPA
eukprot:1415399-Amphidinium_carterae.1